MDPIKTGQLISELRKAQNLTQRELGERLSVSDKTVSKWERGLGCPDIASLNAIASALSIHASELLNGEAVPATNRAGNMRRVNFYYCPTCGNVVASTGKLFLSCCGAQLNALVPQELELTHTPHTETVEDEVYFTVPHPMTKTHYLTFAAWVTSDKLQLTKLYPEQDAAFRFKRNGPGDLYLCCNEEGLFKKRF